MKEILEKRVSRKNFLKTCAILAATGIISLSSISFLKKKNNEKTGYSSGPYGG